MRNCALPGPWRGDHGLLLLDLSASSPALRSSVHDHRHPGTPQDITVQEIRIESFFPMDEATAEFFRSKARGNGA